MASSDRISAENLRGSLDQALEQVNNRFDEQGAAYRVTVETDLEANQPIALQLDEDGEIVPIGITHFAKLTKDFDKVPFDQTARTVDELANSILKAVEIHESAKINPDVLITASGTPFFKNGLNIEIRDGILFVEGTQIKLNGEPFRASRLKGEEGVSFAREDNGDFKVVNPIDEREGLGIFFSKDSGEIYREL